MIEAIRRAAPILATGVVAIGFLAVGFKLGEAKSFSQNSKNITRFIHVGGNTYFDTKLGKDCKVYSDIADPKTPAGLIIDGSCEQEANQ